MARACALLSQTRCSFSWQEEQALDPRYFREEDAPDCTIVAPPGGKLEKPFDADACFIDSLTLMMVESIIFCSFGSSGYRFVRKTRFDVTSLTLILSRKTRTSPSRFP